MGSANRRDRLSHLRPWEATVFALAVYAAWVGVTYALEGRLLTLLRPAATLDRTVYALVANVLVGTVVSLLLVRQFVAAGVLSRDRVGFRDARRTVAGAALAGLAGAGVYVAGTPATTDPVVVANVVAQVLPTSVAEVLVCWVLVGGAVEATVRHRTGDAAAAGALVVTASALFGLYHVAHSPPFNHPGQVALLTGVGLVTSVVFVLTRDLYATAAFHTALATVGVARSLAATDRLGALAAPVASLFAVAAVAALVLVAGDLWLVRRPWRWR